jgi:hypothetical protein
LALFPGRDYYGCFLDFDDAATGAFLQLGQKGVDFFTGLDELDLDGEMV